MSEKKYCSKCYYNIAGSLSELHAKSKINMPVKPNEIRVPRKTYNFNKHVLDH